MSSRIEIGLFVPPRPRHEVAPVLGPQALAGIQEVLVNLLGIEQIGQPVVLGGVKIGQEKILTLQTRDPVLEELHLEMNRDLLRSRAVQPAVTVGKNLARPCGVSGARGGFAEGPERPVGPVAEAENRLGERLLQGLGAVVLVQHEALRPVRWRHRGLAVADEDPAGDLATDRLHQEDSPLLQKERHVVLLDRQVGDRVAGGGVDPGLVEGVEDLLAVTGEVEAGRRARRRSRRCGAGLWGGWRLGRGRGRARDRQRAVRAHRGRGAGCPGRDDEEREGEHTRPDGRSERGRHVNLPALWRTGSGGRTVPPRSDDLITAVARRPPGGVAGPGQAIRRTIVLRGSVD